jgi:hypothetical protein
MAKPSLSRAKAELRAARSALGRMRRARTYDELEDGWRDYLGALEKAWLKAERECQTVRDQFEPWQQQFRAERKSDPLLSYLSHARNADTHTIQDTLNQTPPSIGLGPAYGNSWYIEKLEIKNGQITHYSGDKPMKVTFIPGRLELVTVVDRGVSYEPPKSHRGESLSKTDPISVAELGLTYYESFIAEAERRFFGAIPPAV